MELDKEIDMKFENNKAKALEMVRDLFRKDMGGYSSASTHQYLINKGLESKYYYIDKDHVFYPIQGKNRVDVAVYYRNCSIDVESYLKRNGLI